jgi:hypothetical protein
MKKILLATCVAALFLCQTVLAQTSNTTIEVMDNPINNSHFHLSKKDTILLRFETGEVIFILGIPNQLIATYADSIKQVLQYLGEDLRVAENLPQDATRGLYLYNGKSKRRIKIEDPEYSEKTFDVDEEIYRMKNQLARLRLQMISLPHQMELIVYAKDYSSISTLVESETFNAYMRELQNPSYFSAKSKIAKTSYFTQVSTINNELKVNHTSRIKYIFEGSTYAGPMLVGGDLGAMFGVNLYYTQMNKLNESRMRVGVNVTTATFYAINQEPLNGKLSLMQTYDAFFMRKITESNWGGFQFGIAHVFNQRSPLFVPRLSLLNEFKQGISWSWDIYLTNFTNDSEGLFFSGFTVRLPL